MKKIGIVTKYNGIYGIIETSNKKEVDFSKKDLSSQNIKIGDMVEFREEEKECNLRLARNIKVFDKDNLKN